MERDIALIVWFLLCRGWEPAVVERVRELLYSVPPDGSAMPPYPV